MEAPAGQVRLAELVAILALGQDNAFGQPTGSQLRSCVLAVELAAAMDLGTVERDTVYWVALLRYLGCTGHAYEVAAMFGDDIETRSRTVVKDLTDPREILREIFLHAGDGGTGTQRVRDVLAMLAGGRAYMEMNFQTGCEVGDTLAERLGMSDDVRAALRHTFECWNGAGLPHGVKGVAIPLPMRIVHLTHDMEAIARLQGIDRALEVAAARRDRTYDPAVVGAFVAHGREVLERLDREDPWDAVMAIEAEPFRTLSGSFLDAALLVAADFADLKNPRSAGHSRVVATLAAQAAKELGLSAPEQRTVERAGWLHDLGITGVPTSILVKDGPLTRSESDRYELHPMLTEQMVRRSPALRELVPVAACHHEHLDGTGFPKGLTAVSLPRPARIVAVADSYQLLVEGQFDDPAVELRRRASAGSLDPEIVDALLAAAGHGGRSTRRTYPAGLTAREVEVLVLAARGNTVKQIGAQLFISAKTADRHVQNIYAKIGVSTRGAAALFAIENGLFPT